MILARGSALFLYPLIPWSSVMLSSTPTTIQMRIKKLMEAVANQGKKK
jgi:hypothetical protein